MEVVVYLRVATAEQLSNEESEEQRRLCKKYADDHNLETIKEVIECGISGVQSYSKCKGLREIANMAKDREIDVVLASDASRITQNTSMMIDFQKG